jgi:spermidine synthase
MRAALLALAFVLAVFPARATTIHSERSLYRNIFVTEDDGLRCLTFRRARGGDRQTCFKPAAPKELVFSYTKMMLGSLYLKPDARRILIIGLGGGTLPMTLRELLPAAQIDVVEIDPAVVKVARKYFDFKTDDKLAVYEEDGRVFVKKQMKAGTKYDLVMLDAFEDDYIPEHLLTKEFLLEVKSLLNPQGVLAANTFSSSSLYPHESVTYAAVFGNFYNLKLANRVIWAQAGTLAGLNEIQNNAANFETAFKEHDVTRDWLMTMLSTKPDWDTNARVLTDQYSPSNILNAR